MRTLILGSIEWNQPFGSIQWDIDGNYLEFLKEEVSLSAQNQEPAIYYEIPPLVYIFQTLDTK